MTGVLPAQAIRSMTADGGISAPRAILESQIQPASLDLRIGAKAHRIRASFLTGSHLTVHESIESFGMHTIDLAASAVLEKGCVYLVELQERLRLPEDIHAAANAKSSTGRLDILTRLLVDRGIEFDRVEPGYSGPLYAEICPRSFSIALRTGSRLNQLRFRRGNPQLSDSEIIELNELEMLVPDIPHVDQGLAFSVDLDRGHEPAGYRAKPHAGIIDIDAVASCQVEDFWEPVYATDKQLILDPDSFYILVSNENVRIPPGHAAEMMPYIAMIGEFRVHYAGFFDPGFGWDADGKTRSRAVLEVRCHEVPFVLQHGQQVGRLCFERMAGIPDRVYGTDSNYQGQNLKLSKHFLAP